jgi:hypothetical protein
MPLWDMELITNDDDDMYLDRGWSQFTLAYDHSQGRS